MNFISHSVKNFQQIASLFNDTTETLCSFSYIECYIIEVEQKNKKLNTYKEFQIIF